MRMGSRRRATRRLMQRTILGGRAPPRFGVGHDPVTVARPPIRHRAQRWLVLTEEINATTTELGRAHPPHPPCSPGSASQVACPLESVGHRSDEPDTLDGRVPRPPGFSIAMGIPNMAVHCLREALDIVIRT